MKLADRERVDGTRVTIGRRVYYEAGQQRVSRRYAAEYRDADGRQACENLATTNRSQARRLAIEIQQRLESGEEHKPEPNVLIEHMVEGYRQAVKARGLAPKSEWKYAADLDKLEDYCRQVGITLAKRFSADDLCGYRQWLIGQDYAGKTVQGAVVLAKQAFKWAWRQGLLRDYRLASVSFPGARAKPQPCFTSGQVEQLIEVAKGEEKPAFALMGYAGLRIGEVEQLRWEDFNVGNGRLAMIHVRRGGSGDTTKDKDDRFVPVHPKIAVLLQPVAKKSGTIFTGIVERSLLAKLKVLCGKLKFDQPEQYKLHSFRHHFASLCANNHVAHRKALAWLGHSSSDMLDLYYHLHDEDSQQAMMALASGDENGKFQEAAASPSEGNLRAIGQSTIERTPQALDIQELVECLNEATERGGFEPPIDLRL